MTKDNLYQTGLGFALNKKLKMKSALNQAILRHREDDHFLDIGEQWFVQLCHPKVLVETTLPLTINHFGGIILVLIVTAVLSVPLIYPETYYYRYYHNKLSNRIIKTLSRISIKRITEHKRKRRKRKKTPTLEINCSPRHSVIDYT